MDKPQPKIGQYRGFCIDSQRFVSGYYFISIDNIHYIIYKNSMKIKIYPESLGCFTGEFSRNTDGEISEDEMDIEATRQEQEREKQCEYKERLRIKKEEKKKRSRESNCIFIARPEKSIGLKGIIRV